MNEIFFTDHIYYAVTGTNKTGGQPAYGVSGTSRGSISVKEIVDRRGNRDEQSISTRYFTNDTLNKGDKIDGMRVVQDLYYGQYKLE